MLVLIWKVDVLKLVNVFNCFVKYVVLLWFLVSFVMWCLSVYWLVVVSIFVWCILLLSILC